ncbi:MAG TPA: SRPBCC domain-containing protein [Terriglobia bacterium]|nr:SRPBCC domain-containing protein [Terriglobia bacterium]
MSEIHIAAPPEQVFLALVDPEQVTQWWGGQGAGQFFCCTKFERDLRIGGKWRSEGFDGDGHNFEIAGEYLELDPPQLLVYSWVASWTGNVKTTVRWELEPTKGGTLVRIRHNGLAAHPEVAKSYEGWPRMLAGCRRYWNVARQRMIENLPPVGNDTVARATRQKPNGSKGVERMLRSTPHDLTCAGLLSWLCLQLV